MSEFIAIDFETANERVASPCAVGWAVSEGGSVIDRGSFLIRPPEFRFNGFNVALHGVTAEMCEDAPEWPDALDRLVAVIGNRLVVAHYARFDMGVIRRTCDETGMPLPEFRYACTWRIAHSVWPNLTCYSLPDVAASVGITGFEHHDAAADAWACAGIAVAAAHSNGVDDLAELLAVLPMPPGLLTRGPTTTGDSRHMPREPSSNAAIDPDHPFFGKKVAFTGGLGCMARHDAQQAVVDVGGKAMTSVSRFTDYLVVGGEFHGLLAGHLSHRLEAALTLRSDGGKVELLNEADFVAILRGDQ